MNCAEGSSVAQGACIQELRPRRRLIARLVRQVARQVAGGVSVKRALEQADAALERR